MSGAGRARLLAAMKAICRHCHRIKVVVGLYCATCRAQMSAMDARRPVDPAAAAAAAQAQPEAPPAASGPMFFLPETDGEEQAGLGT